MNYNISQESKIFQNTYRLIPKLIKPFRFILVFLVITGWVFSGWPAIPFINFPPKIHYAQAFSSGPLSRGTEGTAGVTGCTNAVNWGGTGSAPTDASANDSGYTSMSHASNWDSGETSDELRLSNFGFNITGTVTGITVDVLGWANAGSASYTDVILFTAPGTEVGDNKATGSLPTSDPSSTYTTFGSSSDTWNAGLSASQVNDSGFGVVICFTATANNSQINIDHVRITIEYTNSAPTLNVDEPDGVSDTVNVGDNYNIQYDLADTDNTVTVAFYYDSDSSGLDGSAISGACATAAEGTNATCSWDTTGVPAGSYYVYGTTNDGVNSAVSDYSSGQITINAVAATFTQNDFEWYVDETTVTLTDPWPSGSINIAENTALTQLPATNRPLVSGDKIRIQMNITVTNTLSAGGQAFQLEYDTSEDCTTASGWALVGAIGSGTIWRFYDNTSLNDGDSQVNQISTSDVVADYVESNDTQTNPNEVTTGQDMEWDFAVENNGAAENTTYCFRMAKADGTALNTYNADSYPKLTTAPGTANLMRHGNFFQNGLEGGFFWAD